MVFNLIYFSHQKTHCVLLAMLRAIFKLGEIILKTPNLIIYLISLTLSANASAGLSYDYPDHTRISKNNYDDLPFSKGELPKTFQSKSELYKGKEIMVLDRYHRLFSEPDKSKYKTSLARLDRLQVLDLNGDDSNPFIKIKVLSSTDTRLVGEVLYTRINGLSEYEDFKDFDADVYMVQNVATEKLRVYRRLCKDGSCPPKMIFETEFVAGQKRGDIKNKFNTHVGNYRLYEWVKFYQDRGTGGHYPSWYDPSFPEQPGPNESWAKWFQGKVMPWEFCETRNGKRKCSKKGMMRGAFGWYTALMEPHYSSGQWTHGTIGWAESSLKMIKRAKGEDFLGSLAKIFTSLRSSGCSRVSNPSIAFLKHLLPIGTPVFKIYALEAYQDQESMERNYNVGKTSLWDFTLTKDGVRESNESATTAHRNYVELNPTLNNPKMILEKGTYEFDIYPKVVQFQYKPKSRNRYKITKGCIEDTTDNYTFDGDTSSDRSMIAIHKQKRISKRPCNVYNIRANAFKGKFYVDTGLIDGYEHPVHINDKGYNVVIRGGFRSQFFPKFFNVKSYR